MKKLFLTLTICFVAMGLAKAQDNAVGLRVGSGVEVLYQRDLSSKNFLQFTVAMPNFDGISATAIYNWRCCKWDWTPQTCDWHLNAGVGAAAGIYNFNDSGVLVGVAGSCAFGCRFKKVPISLDIDYRPIIGTVFGGGSKGFFTPGFWNFGLAAAYHF